MFFYSNVPLVDPKNCPLASNHNLLAREFNKRLEMAGPSCAWAIFYYADSIFTGMRNTATPGMPLGVNPPEDEWWKVHSQIDLSTAQTGEGNWPMSLAGTPGGANVMNPLNAYIFGRVTSENKIANAIGSDMGPWAEGNIFDGLVETSRGVLSNKSYWSDAFRQRGAYKANSSHNAKLAHEWHNGTGEVGLFYQKYLPGQHDAAWFSKSLFWSGRSSDHFFPEYASNHVYMRYPPNVSGGEYVRYGVPYYPNEGVLRRKNAAKDLLRWVLWVYTYYYRGSEQQRSLFCERKTWDSPVLDFDSTKEYIGGQTFGMKKVRDNGPLNVCRVGFDFFSYMNRQNVFAPCLAEKVFKRNNINEDGSVAGKRPSTDSMGYAKMTQLRPSLKFTINHGDASNNFLGLVNGENIVGSYRNLSSASGKSVSESKGTKIISYENYDDTNEVTDLTGGKMYGKSIRVIGDYEDDGFNMTMLFKDGVYSYLKLKGLEPSAKARKIAKHCMSGYYIETNAVENPNMAFKLKIWGGTVGKNNFKVLHETVIWKKYSYTVNREHNNKAYIYNKMFYFKDPIVDYSHLRFEIVPVLDDKYIDIPVPAAAGADATPSRLSIMRGDSKTNYDARRKDMEDRFSTMPHKHYDKVISFGNPWTNVTQIEANSAYLRYQESTTPDADRVDIVSSPVPHLLVPHASLASLSLSDGDAVSLWIGAQQDGAWKGIANAGGYVLGGNPFFVKLGDWEGLDEDDTSNDRRRVYLSKRRDSSVTGGIPNNSSSFPNILELPLQNSQEVNNWLRDAEATGRRVVIQKTGLNDFLFSATIEPLITLKQKPSFQDLYSLLRVTSEKANDSNSKSAISIGDAPGVGTVGHNFYDSNRIWKNYLRYGSANNIYGSDAVPALRQKVSSNALYESARKFVSSHMRMADRHDLLDYRIEGGKGVLYFKRFNKWIGKIAKATVLKHMEPSVEPAGNFYEGTKRNLYDLPNDNYKPLISGKWYYVYNPALPKLVYMGVERNHNSSFQAGSQSYVDNGSDLNAWGQGTFGAYEIEGIKPFNEGDHPVDAAKNYKQSIAKEDVASPYSSYPFQSNEWVMFMNTVHYNTTSSSIYKPSVYGDIMGFLNNRCHHRSEEYERSNGIKYDMIRAELLRTPLSPRHTPSPRLHVFLSKSPHSFNYIFNTNPTEHKGIYSDGYGGIVHQNVNLDDYGTAGYISDYYRSCPAVTPKPYKVTSCTLVDNYSQPLGNNPYGQNPSSVRPRGASSHSMPMNIVRVELDRPLEQVKGSYPLFGSGGWSDLNKDKVQNQRYRTDENAIAEYLLHKHTGAYNCKRQMLGDYSTTSQIFGHMGYRPFGACYPRFYFLKLIPYVGIDAPLETDPYAQMDFYMRACAGQFIMPYNYYNAPGQVNSVNWKFSELASRASEEDPTSYYYVDPREISNG